MARREGLSAMRVIDSHTEGEPTRVIVEGGPDARRRAARRAARPLRPRVRSCPPLRRQRAARPRCDCRRASLRAGRPVLRGGPHLLQQCRLSRHVRPRDDRPRGDARAYGPDQARRHRFETPVGVVGVELIDERTATIENVESYRLAEGGRGRGRGSRQPCAATSPGAATGSS